MPKLNSLNLPKYSYYQNRKFWAILIFCFNLQHTKKIKQPLPKAGLCHWGAQFQATGKHSMHKTFNITPWQQFQQTKAFLLTAWATRLFFKIHNANKSYRGDQVNLWVLHWLCVCISHIYLSRDCFFLRHLHNFPSSGKI